MARPIAHRRLNFGIGKISRRSASNTKRLQIENARVFEREGNESQPIVRVEVLDCHHRVGPADLHERMVYSVLDQSTYAPAFETLSFEHQFHGLKRQGGTGNGSRGNPNPRVLSIRNKGSDLGAVRIKLESRPSQKRTGFDADANHGIPASLSWESPGERGAENSNLPNSGVFPRRGIGAPTFEVRQTRSRHKDLSLENRRHPRTCSPRVRHARNWRERKTQSKIDNKVFGLMETRAIYFTKESEQR